MSSPSVVDRIAAARAGSLSAADGLLRRYEPWLKLMARTGFESRCAAKFDPADVVQQTMVQAVRDLAAFRGTSEGEWMAWLRQILAHALAHEVRRYAGTAKRDVGREVSIDEDLTAVSGRLGDILPAEGPTPSEEAAGTDRQLLLARLLERLPPDYREVLVLRHLEGLGHEAIAERLGRNPGAVRMLWVRALARLREEASKEGSASGLC
ncbi:MAG: sigma-70 family RNA polymerase sigma factor [Verrucomicrobiales bacterium]|nr:sigma-70 family RNA polymerase sigma factor [Verrucomicrobiales bacterium]